MAFSLKGQALNMNKQLNKEESYSMTQIFKMLRKRFKTKGIQITWQTNFQNRHIYTKVQQAGRVHQCKGTADNSRIYDGSKATNKGGLVNVQPQKNKRHIR